MGGSIMFLFWTLSLILLMLPGQKKSCRDLSFKTDAAVMCSFALTWNAAMDGYAAAESPTLC